MGFKLSHLYTPPNVNPVTLKARSIPFFNPVDIYGRVFFFSWFGFMIAFWAWYTFPPLLTHTIKYDLNLSPTEVANSNIVSLCATLLVRLVAGPLCDQFGPRKVFGGLLLVGSVPLGLAPLVHNAAGLYASRFFIGILGGSFVPCQVWSTGFFDKNIVGTANALTGGFGNAGGGITYFIMPAVYDGLIGAGYVPGQAWRLTFLVPLAMVITTGIALIVLCPDTPTGKWADRHLHAQPYRDAQTDLCSQAASPEYDSTTDTEKGTIVDVPGLITDRPSTPDPKQPPSRSHSPNHDKSPTIAISFPITFDRDLNPSLNPHHDSHHPSNTTTHPTITPPNSPTPATLLATTLTPQTAFHALTYLCTFGAELALNGILASYYAQRFPHLTQTAAANWAALFGFLNLLARPLGGVVSDLLYGYFGSGEEGVGLWWKKGWVVGCGVGAGVGLVVVGVVDSGGGGGGGGGSSGGWGGEGVVFGLVGLVAVLLEAGNGANFSLLPHVHPQANGVVAGLTGAAGNLGGVVFAVVFRFMEGGTGYAKGFWVIGVVHLVVFAAVCWIPPVPRGQVGGR
ncbi:major facilitator superfamily domain-containing protein [Chaetomium fimeti]|uniref:Major facilitator superfamily domain-containing protein n=1 Tax=Chaetomium fimeti TaxID=1854472 RepID=A0AAE0HQQ8_9PEZI|nr:major facilitator superfamily domain-containing protein [Chaetomium fimeti]